jgi:hypothetical protein
MANSTNHSYGKHQTEIINTEADENLGHGLEQAQKCSGSKTGSWDLNPCLLKFSFFQTYLYISLVGTRYIIKMSI